MKSLVFIIAGFVSAISCFAQQSAFNVKVSVGNVKDNTKVFLSYRLDGKEVVDSTLVKGNKFKFEGSTIDPFRATLEIKRENASPRQRDVLSFYVEKGEIVLTSPDSIKNATVSNSKLNDEAKSWTVLTKSIRSAESALYATYRAASDEEKKSDAFQKKIEQVSDSLEKIEKDLALEFIKKHPDSFFNLDQTFRIYLGYYPEGSDAEALFELLSPTLKQSQAGKNFLKKIEAWKQTSVGAIAPDFTQNDPDGKPVQLSSLRGKYLLIDFWASWCGPCRQENPNVVKAFNAYKDKGFTILGVSLDDGTKNGHENWLKAIAADGLTWTHVSDLKYWNNEAAKLYGINAIPANFLLDPDGKIIGRNLRGEALTEKLAEYLK